jgi:glycosyltransferase involved in cell wall biosynthesis
MEACLMGTPMVVTDRCEISDRIDGTVADVVPFDQHAFADGMRRLLTDEARYNTYRKNCPTVMREQFSIDAAVDRLEALYKQLVMEPRADE